MVEGFFFVFFHHEEQKYFRLLVVSIEGKMIIALINGHPVVIWNLNKKMHTEIWSSWRE